MTPRDAILESHSESYNDNGRRFIEVTCACGRTTEPVVGGGEPICLFCFYAPEPPCACGGKPESTCGCCGETICGADACLAAHEHQESA